jgi:serine/threonine protein kinase
MGEVWAATDTRLSRTVACMRLRLDRIPLEDYDHWRQRFEREVRVAAPLEHDNIVRVYDAGSDAFGPYLVTELLDGRSLGDVVAGGRRLSVADACEAARQSAEGLAHAHARHVIHRDVKPGNLFLTRGGRAKVIDWGLGKSHEADDLTQPGVGAGTHGYAPPEQVVDFRSADLRADLFGLGATLLHLLTGRPPAEGREVPPDLPAPLTALLGRLLDAEPSGRPASAREVADALAPHARGADLGSLVGEPRLHASLDVMWWDGAASRYRSLHETGALPMATGTLLHVEARLNRPAYLYLLWIDSEGLLHTLHGWRPGTWDPDAATGQSPRLRWPDYGTDIPLTGPAGSETAVLLAHPAPLAEDVSRHFPPGLRDLFARAMRRMPPDPRRPYEFLGRQDECAAGLKGLGQPVTSPDPLPHVEALLRECLGPQFAVARALTFANRGR